MNPTRTLTAIRTLPATRVEAAIIRNIGGGTLNQLTFAQLNALTFSQLNTLVRG